MLASGSQHSASPVRHPGPRQHRRAPRSP